MSSSLRVAVTKGNKLIKSFYANLDIRDKLQFNRNLFGQVKDSEYNESGDDVRYCSIIVTSVDKISNVCNILKSRYLHVLYQLMELKLSRIACQSKEVYNKITEDIFEANKFVDNIRSEWTAMLDLYSIINFILDDNDLDADDVKIHMYLG